MKMNSRNIKLFFYLNILMKLHNKIKEAVVMIILIGKIKVNIINNNIKREIVVLREKRIMMK